MNPILRSVEFQPVYHQGQQMWLLNDPWQVSEQQLLFPYILARFASECDGGRSSAEIHQALCAESGQFIPFNVITDTLEQLDEVYLLENDRSRRAIADLKNAYRAQPFRPPVFAGRGYSAEPAQLTAQLNNYGLYEPNGWSGRAIVAPHIDYQRGGHIYAQAWQRARHAIANADLVLIFGTDHKASTPAITLSSLPYATPYGIIPTDPELVAGLAEAIGSEDAFRLELNHRQEHSIELAAVWLHSLRRDPCPMIPFLIG